MPGEEIVGCTTGIRGEELDRTRLLSGLTSAFEALSESGGHAAAHAIMITDTVVELGTRSSTEGWTLGGMAKGAGMLAPGLATMLVVITTDAVLNSEQLDTALRAATRVSFDRLDSDGCMSTNDQVTLMSSGASQKTPDLGEFTAR